MNVFREVVYVYDDTIRPGYGWLADSVFDTWVEEWEALQRDIERGTVQWLEPPPQPPDRTAQELRDQMDHLAPKVRAVIQALDERGRWVRDSWICCPDFIRNMELLSAYLDAVKELKRSQPLRTTTTAYR